MFNTLTSCLLLPLLGCSLSLPLQAQDVDEMIIPGEAVPPRSGVLSDTVASPLPYPDVYLPPATTVWLNGTLGWGSTESLDHYYSAFDDVSHLHYSVNVALQLRVANIISLSVNVGEAVTKSTFAIDTMWMSFDQYRRSYGDDRSAYDDGIARRTDKAVMFGLGLHAITSQTDAFAGEVSAGFDVRFQDYENGADFNLMIAARYQPASALRIRLGGMYLHERLTAILSIGVAP